MAKITGKITSTIKAAWGARKAIKEAKAHPTKAFAAAKTVLKENPEDIALAATGPEDPAAWAGAGDLAAKFEKKLDAELAREKDVFRSKETHEQEAERNRRNEEYKKDKAAREDGLRHVDLPASAVEKSVEKREQEMADGSTMAKIAANAKKMAKAPVAGVAAVGGAAYSVGEAATSNAFLAKMLFFFAAGIQLLDISMGFDRRTFFGVIMILYLSLAFFLSFVLRRHGFDIFHNVKQFVILSVLTGIYVLIPFFTWVFPSTSSIGGPSVLDWVNWFLILVPVWPMYISKKIEQVDPDSVLPKIMHIYLFLLVIIVIGLFIWGFATELNAGSIAQIGGRPELVQAGIVNDFLIQKGTKVIGNIWKSIDLAKGIDKIANASGLYYYTGTVDQNEKAPVGLYIDNVRPADKYFYQDSPVIIWADISGKSFGEEIHATPFCYIDTKGKKGEEGDVTPPVVNILGEEHDSLQCTFNDLLKGTYSAKVGASFNFETWAYVTYTFMDLEVKRAMEVQGKSVNSELDIPRLPQSVFTNGPVYLGMGSQVDQPVGVDITNNNRDVTLGVTLDNKWTDGDVERVNKFTIKVPEDLTLLNCDRWYPETEREPTSTEDGYKNYEFSREDLADPRIQFRSVTCRVHIDKPREFLAGQQKVQRTFVTVASYDYVMTKSTSFTVRE